jgi:transcriptional regulator of acetoin/glycerol metabolism
VRLISAANADLHRRVLDGAFRGDLYGRLAGFEARLPPLRDRREDLGMLVRQLAGGTRLTTRAFRRLVDHHWWFNLRELAQTLGTAHILGGTGGAVDAEIFDEIIARRGDVPPDADKVHALRRELIGHLVRSGGDTAQVAEAMGRDRKDIHRWLERFELEPERYRRH